MLVMCLTQYDVVLKCLPVLSSQLESQEVCLDRREEIPNMWSLPQASSRPLSSVGDTPLNKGAPSQCACSFVLLEAGCEHWGTKAA